MTQYQILKHFRYFTPIISSIAPPIQTTPAPVPSKTIHLQGIQPQYNVREFLYQYYQQFGEIIAAEANPALKAALVTFVDEESAMRAVEKGTVLEEGTPPVTILYDSQVFKSVDIPPMEPEKTKVTDVGRKATQKQDRVEANDQQQVNMAAFQAVMTRFVQKHQHTLFPDSASKLDFLDRIDKEMRKGIKRDRVRYHALKGTCADMCPEKERYQRDDRHQATIFECREATVAPNTFEGVYPELDHTKAVKQYSRSSADQEEPLPHELRPATVLNMTMDYLVKNMMGDEQRGNSIWFDFIWNRTRAIRKVRVEII